MICPNCGTQNPGGFKFCGNCAAALGATAPAREQRKTVTVLFCDVTGSTSLGESTDPEALRALLARYFDRMKQIVERHGGTVEKFIGDAVMAVFGVPTVHEDDALRAVRAAVEMRDELPGLGIQARIGINTGEVVTGTTERLATGDAVNVAARLEQAAEPQQILIGEDTYHLVESVVDAQEVERLTLRGKAQPVRAYRLAGVLGSPARRNEAPLVGRATELRRLADAYGQAVRDNSCQLFTVLGTAGVGKSRLVHEFLDGLDATVVTGTCLPYGDGITYWPVIDVVHQLIKARPEAKLSDDLASLLGQESFTAPSSQIAWSFRKLLEEAAADRPLVVVFDDLQWAEPTFLDLVEHVADMSRGAPILLVCMARPDLLDRRPMWSGGKLNATNLLLEPLSGEETSQMVGGLVGGMSDIARERVALAAEGNPLFVEEMAALVRESGDENVRVPPTIHALLAARLDQLETSERDVLERGSIEGRLFHRGAVEALSLDGRELNSRLSALVRKDLVRPDKPELPGEDAYRFRHLLIRDAAYEALPKSTRAQLHERFARWLEEVGADVPELDEIVGYHLEQACRYRTELGLAVDSALATSARQRLATAGRRAWSRGDLSAAPRLLERAYDLPAPPDITLQHDYVFITFLTAGAAATELAEQRLDRALALGDPATVLCARIDVGYIQTFLDPSMAIDEFATLVDAATAQFEAADNQAGLYVTHKARAQIANMVSGVTAVLSALEDAKRASDRLNLGHQFIPPRLNFRILSAEPNTKTLEWIAAEAGGLHAEVDRYHALALAMLGRFDEARPLLEEDLRLTQALAGPHQLGTLLGFEVVEVEELAGDFEAAVTAGEKGCALLIEAGSTGFASTTAGILARAHFYAGHIEKAVEWATRAQEMGAPGDVYTQMLLRQAMGLAFSARGDAEGAESLLAEAQSLAESTQSPVMLGDVLFDTGTAFASLGDRDKAVAAFEHALALYDAKENLVMADRTRTKLADLR